MQISQELVERLLETAPTSLQPNEYLVSAYYPNRNYNRDQFKQRIRSFVIEGCREFGPLASDTQLHQSLSKKIEEAIETVEPQHIEEGIAAFIRVDSDSHDSEIEIIPLSSPPYKSISIGTTYNVDQLAAESQVQCLGLVVYLNRSYTELFLLEDDELTQLIHVENKVKSADVNKQTEKQASPTLYPGSGENKMQQRHHEENKNMLNDIKKYITDNYENFSHLPYIVVVYSSQIAEIAEEFLEEIVQVFNSAEPIAINKNLSTADDIKNESQAVIREHAQMRPHNLLEAAREVPNKYVEDIDDVITAAREGKIRRLFLKPHLVESGYTDGNGLLSTTKLEDTHPVENIIPHLVRQVSQTSGAIFVVDPESVQVPIAAELRY